MIRWARVYCHFIGKFPNIDGRDGEIGRAIDDRDRIAIQICDINLIGNGVHCYPMGSGSNRHRRNHSLREDGQR